MVDGVWRSGNLMVMREDAELPDRCVKTNRPAHGAWADIRLSWHHPALFLVIVLNLIVYFLVAPFVSTSAVVRVGLTEQPRLLCRSFRIATWALLLCASALLIAGFATGLAAFGSAAIILFVIAVPVYFVGARIIWARRIEHGYVWIAGVHPDYLASLPEWPG